MSNNNNTPQHITSIGGQAVMEGVMMRGPHKTAVSVRKSNGEIETKVDENGTKKKNWFLKLPIVRGCVNFIESLVIGMKALMWSAEFVDLEDDEGNGSESKFEKWLEDKLGDKIKDVVIYFSIIISLALSIGLFMILPNLISSGAESLIAKLAKVDGKALNILYNLIEGLVRILIFLGYMILISKMEDIRRVYQYHGAEHKTIACYEAGEELTPANVKKYTRFHPRCGTSFLLFVMIISIILFSFLPGFREGYSPIVKVLLRIVTRLALLPVVSGLSYEVIKLAGRSTNKCVCALSKPGLWLQKLTTCEPDESQIEVAIKSMESVIPESKEDDKW